MVLISVPQLEFLTILTLLLMKMTDMIMGKFATKIIGAVDPHGVLLVVYTERHENTIRIISARKANKKERHLYQ